MTQAKKALINALGRLKDTDRFNIIDFDDSFYPLFDSAMPAIDMNKSNAKRFLNKVSADGGTEMLVQFLMHLDRETLNLRIISVKLSL